MAMTHKSLYVASGVVLGIVPFISLPADAATTITIVGGGAAGPFRYEPANVTVKAGDKVTWVNKTAAEHSVTPDPGSRKSLKGKDIEAHKSYSTSLKTGPGPIEYHCKYHPGMKGTIEVSGQ